MVFGLGYADNVYLLRFLFQPNISSSGENTENASQRAEELHSRAFVTSSCRKFCTVRS